MDDRHDPSQLCHLGLIFDLNKIYQVGLGPESFWSVHQGFLKSKDAEKRLDQLKVQLERGSQQIPPQQLSEFTDWLKEQQDEVGTFSTHCLNRQKQMESLLGDLNR